MHGLYPVQGDRPQNAPMKDEEKSREQLLSELVELRKHIAELETQEERYIKLVAAVTDYIYIVLVEDGRPVKTLHGPGCFSVTGYTSEEYETDPMLWIKMVYEKDREAVIEQANKVLSGKAVQPLEHRITHKDGSVRWVRNTPVPRYEHDRLVAYDGLIADVTERKQAEEQVIRQKSELETISRENARLYEEARALSLRDSLTGCGNRRYMEIMLKKIFAESKRYGRHLSAIMLDIDYFKKYNDTYGHIAGDDLLVRLAAIISQEIRETDIVIRYGGEEFLIVLPETELQSALEVAERIRKEVETRGDVTVSLGVSAYGQEMKNKEALVSRADEALYQAKGAGRNRVVVTSGQD